MDFFSGPSNDAVPIIGSENLLHPTKILNGCKVAVIRKVGMTTLHKLLVYDFNVVTDLEQQERNVGGLWTSLINVLAVFQLRFCPVYVSLYITTWFASRALASMCFTKHAAISCDPFDPFTSSQQYMKPD